MEKFNENEIRILAECKYGNSAFSFVDERDGFVEGFKKAQLFYRNVLHKYIKHVQDCEGCDFIGTHMMSGVEFSFEEIELLKFLSNN